MAYSAQPFALENLPLNDKWGMYVGEVDGAPVSVRLNESAMHYLAHPELPVRVDISVPLHTAEGGGVPSEDEQAQIAYIETVFFELVTAARVGRVVYLLATPNTCEFMAYVRSAAHAEDLMGQLSCMITTHEIVVSSVEDDGWEGYAQKITRRSIAETDLLTGKAALIAYRIVGWLFMGLAVIVLAAVLGGILPMAIEMTAGTGSFELAATGALLVLLPLGVVGIIAYVGVRFLKQSKSPA